MRSIAWAALLRHIPPALHDNLTLVARSGVEITIQAILRIDHEFLGFRGRLAGSTDAGRVYFIPYSHIDYLGFTREVKDAEYREVFDNLVMPLPDAVLAAPVAPSAALALSLADAPQTAETEAAADGAAASNAPATRMNMPIKSAVLERFRQRAPNGPANGQKPPDA
jgi:hypothetical protein